MMNASQVSSAGHGLGIDDTTPPAPKVLPPSKLKEDAPSIDRCDVRTTSWPLKYFPSGGLNNEESAHLTRGPRSYLPYRFVPARAVVPDIAATPEQVVKPTLKLNSFIAQDLQLEIRDLFEKLVNESTHLGLGNSKPTEIHIQYYSRREWSDRLMDRDIKQETKTPSSGLRSLWIRVTRWLARLAHTLITPIYFDRDGQGDIRIIGENFGRRLTPERGRLLAEAIIRSLQQSTYPNLKNIGSSDFPATADEEALTRIHVHVCLQALERHQGVDLHNRRWFYWPWRRGQRLGREEQWIVDHLLAEKDVDAWFRRMLPKTFWAKPLMSKEREKDLGKNHTELDRDFIAKALAINPYGQSRLKE